MDSIILPERWQKSNERQIYAAPTGLGKLGGGNFYKHGAPSGASASCCYSTENSEEPFFAFYLVWGDKICRLRFGGKRSG